MGENDVHQRLPSDNSMSCFEPGRYIISSFVTFVSFFLVYMVPWFLKNFTPNHYLSGGKKTRNPNHTKIMARSTFLAAVELKGNSTYPDGSHLKSKAATSYG